jgi:hypothetical protein
MTATPQPADTPSMNDITAMSKHAQHSQNSKELWSMAVAATLHCLAGCGIGEVVGMILTTWWGWGNVGSIALSIALSFVFGYALTMTSLVRGGIGFRRALGLALAADTVSIICMEIVDNLTLIAVPGVMTATLKDWLFWSSLALSLVIAFVVALPVNRILIAKGKGHAVVHGAAHQH